MTHSTDYVRAHHRTHSDLEALVNAKGRGVNALDRALDDVAAYRVCRRIAAELEAAGIPLDLMQSAIEARRATRG